MTDTKAKGEKMYNNSKTKEGLFILGRSAGGNGLKKRRAAEYLMYEFSERLKLDVTNQKAAEKAYDKLTEPPKDTKDEKKEPKS